MMLILTLKTNESLMIGDDIKVVILSGNRNGKIELGIKAPKDIPVHREEIFLQIKEEDEILGNR
jgi:carbon storage regulator